MNKAKFKEVAVVILAWTIALILFCFVYIKAKILFNF